jgi:Tol biopolymer transport system component
MEKRPMKGKHLGILLTLILLLVACTIEVSEQDSRESPPTSGEKEAESDQQDSDGRDGEGEPGSTSISSDPNLTGHLYYLALVGEEQQLLSLDLKSGDETVIFTAPEMGWLNGAAVSPDGEQIVLSYSAPPEQGQIQFGFTDLHLMPVDGSTGPEPLITKEDPSEAFFNVSWPLEDTIYYAHVVPSADESGVVTYGSQIERIDVNSGESEILMADAAWPRLGYDNLNLAFVNNDQELIISKADGSDPEELFDANRFSAIDAPLFSRDGDVICFSAVPPLPESARSIWDQLMGVKMAEAHSVPSDWWCLSLDGSEDMVQMTDLGAIGLYGDFSEDGTHIAFIASDGVYIMQPDGSDLRKIKEVNAFGTLDWVP